MVSSDYYFTAESTVMDASIAVFDIPIITELEPPMCSKWSVLYTDGTPGHIVCMTADHILRQDIFTCDCGCKYTWSKGRDYDEPCRHVVAVTVALLVDSGC